MDALQDTVDKFTSDIDNARRTQKNLIKKAVEEKKYFSSLGGAYSAKVQCLRLLVGSRLTADVYPSLSEVGLR